MRPPDEAPAFWALYNMRFKYLKKFFDWCLEEGLLSCAHPLAGLKKRRPVGRVVHIETDTLADLLRLPDRRTFTGLRDYALILFSLDCGVRPGESLQLRSGDFDLAGLLVTIPAPAAKTRQARTVPITAQTVLAVQHPNFKKLYATCDHPQECGF